MEHAQPSLADAFTETPFFKREPSKITFIKVSNSNVSKFSKETDVEIALPRSKPQKNITEQNKNESILNFPCKNYPIKESDDTDSSTLSTLSLFSNSSFSSWKEDSSISSSSCSQTEGEIVYFIPQEEWINKESCINKVSSSQLHEQSKTTYSAPKFVTTPATTGNRTKDVCIMEDPHQESPKVEHLEGGIENSEEEKVRRRRRRKSRLFRFVKARKKKQNKTLLVEVLPTDEWSFELKSIQTFSEDFSVGVETQLLPLEAEGKGFTKKAKKTKFTQQVLRFYNVVARTASSLESEEYETDSFRMRRENSITSLDNQKNKSTEQELCVHKSSGEKTSLSKAELCQAEPILVPGEFSQLSLEKSLDQSQSRTNMSKSSFLPTHRSLRTPISKLGSTLVSIGLNRVHWSYPLSIKETIKAKEKGILKTKNNDEKNKSIGLKRVRWSHPLTSVELVDTIDKKYNDTLFYDSADFDDFEDDNEEFEDDIEEFEDDVDDFETDVEESEGNFADFEDVDNLEDVDNVVGSDKDYLIEKVFKRMGEDFDVYRDVEGILDRWVFQSVGSGDKDKFEGMSSFNVLEDVREVMYELSANPEHRLGKEDVCENVKPVMPNRVKTFII